MQRLGNANPCCLGNGREIDHTHADADDEANNHAEQRSCTGNEALAKHAEQQRDEEGDTSQSQERRVTEVLDAIAASSVRDGVANQTGSQHHKHSARNERRKNHLQPIRE